MGKPIIHARSSAERFGGKPEDYLDIHEFLDSSRQAFSDLRHRALTHNSWFITTVLPKVFGTTRKNSVGKVYSVTEVGERHVHEDYRKKFIPTAQDFLQQIVWLDWMENGKRDRPTSAQVPGKSAIIKSVSKPKPKKNKGKWIKAKNKPVIPEFPEFVRHPCNFD